MNQEKYAHYTIQKSLGEGVRGEVFLAHDTELDRDVALKISPDGITQDPEAVAAFVQEARMVAGLQHPNIATIYTVSEHDGSPFIAMEYVEGRSLADLMTDGPLVVEEAIDIAAQICRALAEFHRQGIKQVNPAASDILIGANGRVRILAFGLVEGQPGPGDSTAVAQREISPDQPTEVISGHPMGPPVDLRSLGALFYEMITGETPVEGQEKALLAGKISAMNTRSLLHSNRVLKQQLSEIVERALGLRPAERYTSAEAMARDLQHLLGKDASGVITVGPRPKRSRWPVVALALILVVAAAAVIAYLMRDSGPVEVERKMIVVLPFENLGPAEDDYFAEGITAEITARLSALDQLGVISRTSAARYIGTQKSVRVIADELGVDYVIEGTIRWDKSGIPSRVRIKPQLIRASDDTHLWGETYERELTEIFTLQSDIATEIVAALDITLLARERSALSERPTESVEAYEAYLRGLKPLLAADFSRESFRLSMQMFKRAIEFDPEFALAHARLSAAYSRLAHYGFDRSENNIMAARDHADRAIALNPELPAAHLSLGLYYYWARRDYGNALGALAAARELAPGDPEIIQATAFVKRRQGDLEGCAVLLEQSLELDPVDATTNVVLGETYGTLREYARGEKYFKRAISLAPDSAYPYTELALLYLRWRGDTAAARKTLDAMAMTIGTEPCRVWFFVELFDRDFESALDRLRVCDESVLEAGVFFIPIPLLEGVVHDLQGDTEGAAVAFAEARVVLEQKLTEAPDDHRAHAALGIALAGLGDNEAALRHGERAVQLYPLAKDALEAPTLRIDLALIQTMIGDHQAALQQLDELLSMPAIISTAWIEADPRWDPLREDPGYRELLARHAQ